MPLRSERVETEARLAGPEVEQKLAAILAADVAGYTRLMAEDEPATIATITEYRSVFRGHIEANGGRVVDMAGDSVLAIFTSVAGAVKAAVDAQSDLAERNKELQEDRRMLFRIGVNLSDIHEAADGKIYGDGINIAARLESLAEPGGIMLSESAHLQVRRDPGYRFADAGEHKVKNVAALVHAYRIENNAGRSAESSSQLTLPDKPSIAVLAFDNLSRDPDEDYLADGISEDIITALSRIHWLLVTARNSTFTYKGRAVDVKRVGRELGVRYVVEGSVRRSGTRTRVTAQLIDATTGNHLWAERYDRQLEDIFALQDEIADTVAVAIEPELGAAERDRAARRVPESLESWSLYQRGLDHLYRFTAEDNTEAKRLFQAAADADPRFAAPLGALAYALWYDDNLQFADDLEIIKARAMEAGRAAVSRDHTDPMAHFGLGRALAMSDKLSEAIDELKIAIRISPNFALAYNGLSVIFCLASRFREAIENAEIAARLSPQDPVIWGFENNIAIALIGLGDFDQALEVARRASRRPNSGYWPQLAIIAALAQLGRKDEIQAEISALSKTRPPFPVNGTSQPSFRRWQQSIPNWSEGLQMAGLIVPDPSSAQ